MLEREGFDIQSRLFKLRPVKLGNKQLVERLTRFRDLSRLRPRVFRDDRNAVGDATGPALATCSSWRSERESVLRINGVRIASAPLAWKCNESSPKKLAPAPARLPVLPDCLIALFLFASAINSSVSCRPDRSFLSSRPNPVSTARPNN